MYFHKTPWWLKRINPGYTWHLPAESTSIALTFDDGPTTGVTPWVLNELNKRSIGANFFVIGKNIETNGSVLRDVLIDNHTVGNHTYNHLNGWKVDSEVYLNDFKQCDRILSDFMESTPLFRPPYGKIKKRQAQQVLKTHKIIMWDYLSGDFDSNVPSDQIIKSAKKHVKPGTILLFHDNEKAFPRLKKSLPDILDYLLDRGYHFKQL